MNNLAKTCLNQNDYDTFMAKVNNQQLNSARLFIEDKMDEVMFNNKLQSISHKKQIYSSLKQLDNIVTNEYINQIDVNGATRISK